MTSRPFFPSRRICGLSTSCVSAPPERLSRIARIRESDSMLTSSGGATTYMESISNDSVSLFSAAPIGCWGNMCSRCSKGSVGGVRTSRRLNSSYTKALSRMYSSSSSQNTSRSDALPNAGNRDFIWRTTERRFIDFCLSPEEEERLKLLHDRIVASPWSFISKEELANCLLLESKGKASQDPSLLQRLRLIGSYILSPRGLEEDGRRLFRTLIPRYEDTHLTEKYFGIGEADFNGRVYFLLLHLWSLHCALHQAISEFKVPAILREQQFVSFGFCVSLDEAFEDEAAGPAGQLAHRLWVTVFGAAESKYACNELIALTTYAMRIRHFAMQLPTEALVTGAFSWPQWPPP
ncbi:ubiquinol-cytochrome c related protein [Cyclospora cayetanensis]|uniref:Ubiquinol-cytochrome c related protein n=1 Tax=Cyclospora cayetanensis TaxID=88456 RepID=A0A1D3CXB2_9EIME|nr:ubiquinol-cytochrome c related protein [Cyclospora cayetanensis]